MSATIYGREGIANCFDASQARRAGLGELGLQFVFDRHTGGKAARLWDLMNLDALAGRIGEGDVSRQDLGLGPTDCFSAGRAKPLRTLTVIERGGGGMPGAIDDVDSVLARALMNVGEAQVSAGAAGSYGYGKAAVAQASRVRIVLAYTCFTPVGSSSVSRRFVGLTYWGMHQVGGNRFTGWALLGTDQGGGSVSALENDAADLMAAGLGIPIRQATTATDLGTTFYIIDPAFNAEQLRGAIELFWWPLLLGTRSVQLNVTIANESGQATSPEVKTDHPVLGQFVETFLAAERARNDGETESNPSRTLRVGEAGLTSLEIRRPDSVIGQSLIAQMRSPLMVVGYANAPAANPPVLGVFVAHEGTNEHLRRVEPPEHDKWQTQNVGGLNASPADINVAKAVKHEREAAIADLRAPDPEPVFGISAFSRHFPAVDVRVARPKSPSPRKVKQRLVRVHLVHQEGADLIEVDRPTRIAESGGRLAAGGEVKFFLDSERAQRVGRKSLDATITIGAQISEESGHSSDWWPARVTQKKRGNEPDFTRISAEGVYPSKFEGRFTIGTGVYFVITTEPYPSDWTVEMVFDCSPWDIAAPTQSVALDSAGGPHAI